MISRALYPGLVAALFCGAGAAGQEPGRIEYYSHLPPYPPLVTQTEASARFALYGDRSHPRYRDAVPRDGIDDERAQLLRRLAARFSPVLRRNNFSRPQDFRSVLGGRPVLRIDTWRNGRQVRSDSVLLFELEPPEVQLALGDSTDAADTWQAKAFQQERSDSTLAELVRDLDPARGEARTVRAEHADMKVLFIDFPGEDERSWRTAYEGQRESRIYAHFFINEQAVASTGAAFDFVIQYWFFYPFNDGPNNHEGDWEHVSVLATTRARADRDDPDGGRLEAGEVQRILAGELTDSLVIRAVEYYFHESVMVVDYLAAREVRPLGKWEELKHLHIWRQPHFIDGAISGRLHEAGGRLANHPVVYIGGNAKGPDELLAIRPRFNGSYNRNTHGSYPFPGTWQGVGPLGSTESVAGEVVPRLRSGGARTNEAAALSFEDDHMLYYGESEILLMPDWEHVRELVQQDAVARREWSWMLLPIRWGYPASVSVGGGAIKHTDMGHLAPVGPQFKDVWNRLAAETNRQAYAPRVLRVLVAPVTPWDRIHNGWGVLNVPRALMGFLPGFNVLLSSLGPWLSVPADAIGLGSGRTFGPELRPSRFTSTGIGAHRQTGGEGFAQMLPNGADAGLASLLRGQGSPPVRPGRYELSRTGADGFRGWLNVHYGRDFAVQNSYSRSRSKVSYQAMAIDGQSLGPVAGDLDLQELLGGFRYRLGDIGNTTQLYAGGGWGWTWYEVERVSFGAEELMEPARKGGYVVSVLPSNKWWPNTWYATLGVEFTAPRTAWLMDGVGYGVFVEYTGLQHRLGARTPTEASPGWAARRDLSAGLAVSW